MTLPPGLALVVSATLLVSSLISSAHAADLTVSAGGSISSAINRANPGDRVLVRAGSYPSGTGWIERSGTAAASITVIAVDGPGTAVVQGGGESFRVGNSAWLVFDGFEVRNSGDNAIHIDNSNHITLRHFFAHDAGFNGDVCKVNQSQYITVEDSEFARPGARDPGVGNPSQECLDFVDVDNAVVRRNHFHDSGSMLMYVKGGSRNAIIEGNTFTYQRAGASDPMVGIGAVTDANLLGGERYEAIDTVFRNNILVGGTNGALGIYDAQGAYIADNLFLDNDRVLVEFRAGNGPAGGSTDVRLSNNLFVDTRGRMPVAYLRSSHTVSALSTVGNLYWNHGAALPACALVAIASETAMSTANPFVRAVASDAMRAVILATTVPGAGSAAQVSGADVSVAPYLVTDDVLGAVRTDPRVRGPFALTAVAAPGGDAAVTPVVDAATIPVPVRDAAIATVPDATGTPAPGRDAGALVLPDAASTSGPDAATSTSCPPEVTTLVNGEPRNAAGRIRECWPGEMHCVCDADNDCYRVPGYLACGRAPGDAGLSAPVETAVHDGGGAAVADGGATCPPEPTTLLDNVPRNAAGRVRQCWPGDALCVCDDENDCYRQPGYVSCAGIHLKADGEDDAGARSDASDAHPGASAGGCSTSPIGNTDGALGTFAFAALFASAVARRRGRMIR